MKKLYELEMTRKNVTPRAFYGMVRKSLLKKGGVELETWVGDDGFKQWANPCKEYDAHSTENETICVKPFDFHIAYKGAYNVIMEFQFDDDERGSGYAYICEYEPQQATTEAAANAPQEATDNEQEESKVTLLDVHTMNARAIEEEDILSVTVYRNGGDEWMEFADVAEAMNEFGRDAEVAEYNVDNHGTLHILLAEPEAAAGQPATQMKKQTPVQEWRFAKCKDGLICAQYPTEFDENGEWKNWRERWFETEEEAERFRASLETPPKLEIRRLKNAKFGFPHLYVNFTGWALFDKERGYVAFSAQRDKRGILIPYFPQGGKKALQAIMNQGGFVSYDGIEFVMPMAS